MAIFTILQPVNARIPRRPTNAVRRPLPQPRERTQGERIKATITAPVLPRLSNGLPGIFFRDGLGPPPVSVPPPPPPVRLRYVNRCNAPRLTCYLLPGVNLTPRCVSAGVICEDLPQDLCSFAVSSASKRCLLENTQLDGGRTDYQCKTSEAVVEGISNWIETDECVRACGVARGNVGISSDSLMEPDFVQALCSADCYSNCPNIVDLFFNLANGEGVFLPDLCEAQRADPRRAMAEFLSSGAAPGPVAPPPVST
ncbi:hypothetical protein B296_00000971 [Ensete ventricosum]|uniref:PAR1 protein n=1 Tax=Ensete ventricosum TaxID=4639 RepID=A0A427B0V3_ENSVE|nr:hypothetical protein B296_00000971 [Ensete ventricosum]